MKRNLTTGRIVPRLVKWCCECLLVFVFILLSPADAALAIIPGVTMSF